MSFKFLDLSNGKVDPVIDGVRLQVFKVNSQRSRPMGVPKTIIMHWTAGAYNQVWDDYHFNITYNPKTGQAHVIKMLDWDSLGLHLWGRNTGTIGITFCAMANATGNKYGQYPVTAQQVEAAAKLIAEICAWKQLDPTGQISVPGKKRVGDSLVDTGKLIQAPVLTDHAFYAKKDGYASDRWDIGPFMPKVYQRAIEEYKQLKAGSDTFNFKPLLS